MGTYPAERLLLSPSDLPEHQPVVPWRLAWVAADGDNPLRKERRDHSEVMLIRPQQVHESSMNASSACWKPRH